jgi:hypothetical protein
MSQEVCPCPHAQAVSEKMKERATHGLTKYGVTCARTDLTRVQWLRHAQEEAMDLAVYLERLIHDERIAVEYLSPGALELGRVTPHK